MSNIALVSCIDTHAHLDGEEYAEDRREMIERARAAGVSKVFLPAIDLPSVDRVVAMSREFYDYCYPMIGLHPEEVRADYKEVLAQIYEKLSSSFSLNSQPSARLRQETLSKQSEERTLNAQHSTLNAQHSNLTTTLGDIVELWHKLLPNAEILPISAKNKFGTEILLKRIKELLPESPAFFDKDQLTDKPARFFVSEIIREKILLYYDKEIPYSVEVAVESFKESEKIIRISAVIYVERDSQKGIIIGHQGIALKKMSTEARKSLERFFDKSIYLECFVKVDKDWRSSQRELNNFGYNPG